MKNWDKLDNEKPEWAWWEYILATLLTIILAGVAIFVHCNFYAPNYKALGKALGR